MTKKTQTEQVELQDEDLQEEDKSISIPRIPQTVVEQEIMESYRNQPNSCLSKFALKKTTAERSMISLKSQAIVLKSVSLIEPKQKRTGIFHS